VFILIVVSLTSIFYNVSNSQEKRITRIIRVGADRQ
jgi:hypothetical protein